MNRLRLGLQSSRPPAIPHVYKKVAVGQIVVSPLFPFVVPIQRQPRGLLTIRYKDYAQVKFQRIACKIPRLKSADFNATSAGKLPIVAISKDLRGGEEAKD